MGYIYQADVYCDGCGDMIRETLKADGAEIPEDDMDLSSYDSGDYPKPVDVKHGESDSPQHCVGCQEFMHNQLTSDGYQYVQNVLNNTDAKSVLGLSDVERKWMIWYGFSYWDAEDCEDDSRGFKVGWNSREMY